MQERWEDVRASTDLKVLIPNALAYSHFSILRRREILLPKSAANEPFFNQALPFEIAKFRPEILEPVAKWSQAAAGLSSLADLSLASGIRYGFEHDIKKIFGALFYNSPESSVRPLVTFQFFNEPPTPKLHYDRNKQIKPSVYALSRVGNDPFELIDGWQIPRLTKIQQNLVWDAMLLGEPRGTAAKKKLREMGILRRAALGSVYLMSANVGGTLHCSSDMRVYCPPERVKVVPKRAGLFRHNL
jgi:hypothetical protein